MGLREKLKEMGIIFFRMGIQYFENWPATPMATPGVEQRISRRAWEARRHDNLHILWVCDDNTANNPYNLRNAINKYTKHECKLVQGKQTYLGYPLDGTIMAEDITRTEFISLVLWADVIHLNESVVSGIYPPEHDKYFKDGTRINLYDIFQPHQKVFRHSNGTYYRNNFKYLNYLCEKHNMYKTVSTPDLISLGSNNYWLPQPIPLDQPKYKIRARWSDKIRVSHSPTNRVIKGTDTFLAVCKSRFPDMEVVLIEKMTHGECLKARKKCLVHYDQYSLGAYGVASLEALSIGQVCIVGIDNIFQYIPDSPFVEIDGPYPENMEDALIRARNIASDEDNYKAYCKKAKEYLVYHHSDKVVVKRLCDMYEHAGFYIP